MKAISLIFLAVCFAIVAANQALEPLVVGGREANAGQFPYQVSEHSTFQIKSNVTIYLFNVFFDGRFRLDLHYSDHTFVVLQF